MTHCTKPETGNQTATPWETGGTAWLALLRGEQRPVKVLASLDFGDELTTRADLEWRRDTQTDAAHSLIQFRDPGDDDEETDTVPQRRPVGSLAGEDTVGYSV